MAEQDYLELWRTTDEDGISLILDSVDGGFQLTLEMDDESLTIDLIPEKLTELGVIIEREVG